MGFPHSDDGSYQSTFLAGNLFVCSTFQCLVEYRESSSFAHIIMVERRTSIRLYAFIHRLKANRLTARSWSASAFCCSCLQKRISKCCSKEGKWSCVRSLSPMHDGFPHYACPNSRRNDAFRAPQFRCPPPRVPTPINDPPFSHYHKFICSTLQRLHLLQLTLPLYQASLK